MASEGGGQQPGRVLRHPMGSMRVPVQASVHPETRQRIRDIADACGASIGLVVELLITRQELDPTTGRPVWWDDAIAGFRQQSEQEGLPLTG